MKNKDIIIQSADKGGDVVSLNRSDYLTEAERNLSETDYYRCLNEGPTPEFQEAHSHLIIKAFDGLILNKK